LCKAIVCHYRSSTQAVQKLAEKLNAAGKAFKVLLQDTPTRWWSINNVMDRINQNKTCLNMLEVEEEILLSKEFFGRKSMGVYSIFLRAAEDNQRGTAEG
jgi:hypothetical protein